MRVQNTLMASMLFWTLLAFDARSAEIVGKVTVEDDWFEDKIEWAGGIPPTYRFRLKAMVQNGVVVLCGAGYFSGELAKETRAFIKDFQFFIDDTLLLQDFSFFSKVRRRSDLVGAKANCASTGKRPPNVVKDGFSLRRANPNRVFH